MVKIPAYLKQGDTIGVTCPAGFMAREKIEASIDVFHEWGFKTKIGRTVYSESLTYFSATDQERLEDLQEMLDDEEVKAIFCARGGYGIGRIIDRIEFKKFKKNPKWIIGYSDVTILHAHIYSNFEIATLHAPMASAFADGQDHNEFVKSIRQALVGRKIKYQCEPHPFNHRGEAVGELVGGNLSLLCHLIGTPSEPGTKGRILFLEDVGEYLYHIDRMFFQLKRSGKLDKLAGLIIGRFTESKDTERPFGKEVTDLIHDLTREFRFPVCFGFPVGHVRENYALKTGIGYKLRVSKSKVILEV
jgi:muramoyltetrapeptide carboxypeptidase